MEIKKKWVGQVDLKFPIDIVNGCIFEYISNYFLGYENYHYSDKTFKNFDFNFSVPGYMTYRLIGIYEARIGIRKSGEKSTLLSIYMPQKTENLDHSHYQEGKGIEFGEDIRNDAASGQYEEVLREYFSIIQGILNRLRVDGIMDYPKTIKDVENQILKPWELIEDHLWDKVAVEMWCKGHTNREISRRVNVLPRSVTNRICYLRKRFPEAGIPKNDERRKLMILDDTG